MQSLLCSLQPDASWWEALNPTCRQIQYALGDFGRCNGSFVERYTSSIYGTSTIIHQGSYFRASCSYGSPRVTIGKSVRIGHEASYLCGKVQRVHACLEGYQDDSTRNVVRRLHVWRAMAVLVLRRSTWIWARTLKEELWQG